MADLSQERFFYSSNQVMGASLLGGPLAGFWFISRNFLFTGEPQKAEMAIAYGVAASFLLGGIVVVLDKLYPGFPRDVLPIVYSSSLGSYSKIASPSLLAADKSMKGSSWSVSGLSLAFLIPSIGLMAIPVVICHLLIGNS